MAGCGRREEPRPTAEGPARKESQVLTNDTYIPGRGYYHAPFFTFFPFPYNHYRPGAGYYRGGQYHSYPDYSVLPPTKPGPHANVTPAENVNRGGFARSKWIGRSGVS